MSRSRTLILALLLTLVVSAAALLAACGNEGTAAPAASPQAADAVVLLVDGRPVRLSALEAVRAEFRLGGSSDARARAEKEVVRRELLRQEAERLGVKADQAEVQSRRDAMADQAGGEDALTQVLRGVPMTEAQLRSGLQDGVLHEAVQDVKFDELAATAAQARSYYDRHRAAFREEGSLHLYGIQVPAERVAQNALKRLREGRPFEEVARQFSTEAEGKANGGDMGVVALASLPASFAEALKTVGAGQVAGPVQGPGGWFLLKAKDLRQARVTPFGEVRDDLVAELTRRGRFRALEKWLDAARDRASVTRP